MLNNNLLIKNERLITYKFTMMNIYSEKQIFQNSFININSLGIIYI